MGTKIETDMRRDMFAHLQKLSFSYFDNTKIGQLMSRITTDLFDITEFAHHCPEEFFIAGIKIIGAFVILCTMSVPLTLIIFAVLPFMLRPPCSSIRECRRSSAASASSSARSTRRWKTAAWRARGEILRERAA